MKTLIYETIKKQQAMLMQKEISSVALTEAYLTHIQETDSEIGAYLHLDAPSALRAAQKIDDQRMRGESLGPLAGIPMALKDNICTLDMPTTCASKMLDGYQPPYDAKVVQLLKGANAIILGKLNMDEFAMGASTENSYFKKTRNPIAPDRVPGGSSGGSAAAVASHQAAYTLGSDTGGSVRQPASFCGVVGLKPTYGRISRSGLIAFASSLDQIGPLAKTVEDVTEVFTAISGYDPMDSTSSKAEVMRAADYLSGDVSKMKIALPKSFFGEGIEASVKAAVHHAAKVFESLGATIIEVDLPNLDAALPAYYLLSSAEASSNLARFDGVQYGYRTDAFDSIETLYKQTRGEGFGREVKRRILLGTYALSSGYYDAYYQKALKVRTLIQSAFNKIFETCDFILSPVAPTTAYTFGAHDKSPVEMYLGDVYTVPVNIAGLPGLSVNCGYDEKGLPIGMQLIGQAFDEKTILSAGHAFEQTKQIWRAV